MDLVNKAFDGSSVLCCSLDELNLQKKNVLGLEALKISLAIQVRANRVKRQHILKKYKKSLKAQDTADNNDFNPAPIKIPNKITPTSSPIRTYSKSNEIASDVIKHQLRKTGRK